jgi:pimeloyl-ACP methyl ester carboxylesterase
VSFIRDPLLSLFVNNPLLAEKLLYSFMYKKDVDILEITKLTTLPFNKEGVNHAYGEWFQEFFIPSSIIPDSISLKNIQAPISVLWGDKDTVISEDKFFELQQVRPDAKKVTLEDVGHMPHLEDLGLFVKELTKVLK